SIRSMTGGSSMQAMTLTAPPHFGQDSTSIWNTRLRRCAQRIAERCSAGVRSSDGCGLFGLPHRPRRAGVMRALLGLFGATTPWKRVRFSRGGGTRAASRAMKSSGSKITCVVPSRYGVFKPRSTKRSSSLNEVASSAVQPKTLPPNTSGAISRPERPSGRLFMMFRLLYPGNVSGDGFNRAAVDPQCGTGGGAGLRRSRVDAEVGDLLRLGEVPEQVRGAIPGQEQAFHFQRSDAALGGQVGHH